MWAKAGTCASITDYRLFGAWAGFYHNPLALSNGIDPAQPMTGVAHLLTAQAAWRTIPLDRLGALGEGGQS